MDEETAKHIASYVVWNTLDAIVETEGYEVDLSAMNRMRRFIVDQLIQFGTKKEGA